MFHTSLSDLNYVAKLLVPEELTQVCIGEHQVIFNFTGELSILIQSQIEITSDSSSTTILSDKPEETKHLVNFLGKSIQSHRVEDGAIVLIFSDDSSLKMLRNDYYESFSIVKGQNSVYV